MRIQAVALSLLTCLALTGCGDETAEASYGDPFTLPVGTTTWDIRAPAWLHDGTLHVGQRTVELGDDVDRFVLGATGVYWMRGTTLMFTSVEGASEKVEDVGWGNLAVSADRSVFATVDQSRGPKDRYGTHVIQLAVFDTRTGKQLHRTPDEEPDPDDDLADLYGEIMPLLLGVSNERAFFYGDTIDLHDGSTTPASQDADGIDDYEGAGDTLFPDGYRVSIRGEGQRRELVDTSLYAAGILSPDRSTLFDQSVWPTEAVAYDATTGRQRPIDAPWDHFTLRGWSDKDTFFGVAERIDEDNVDNVLRAQQVVTCELATLACTPVSPVIATGESDSPTLLMENSDTAF